MSAAMAYDLSKRLVAVAEDKFPVDTAAYNELVNVAHDIEQLSTRCAAAEQTAAVLERKLYAIALIMRP